jgi:hypothetical protein
MDDRYPVEDRNLFTEEQRNRARTILANARRDLGYELHGRSRIDLLLDNMEELRGVTDAFQLLIEIGERLPGGPFGTTEEE